MTSRNIHASYGSSVFASRASTGLEARVRGTGGAGGEDKERSGTGTALTRAEPVLVEDPDDRGEERA